MADEEAWEEGSHARVIQEAARHNRTDVIQAAVAHYNVAPGTTLELKPRSRGRR